MFKVKNNTCSPPWTITRHHYSIAGSRFYKFYLTLSRDLKNPALIKLAPLPGRLHSVVFTFLVNIFVFYFVFVLAHFTFVTHCLTVEAPAEASYIGTEVTLFTIVYHCESAEVFVETPSFGTEGVL